MIIIKDRASQSAVAKHRIFLPFEMRQKARFVAELENGTAVGFQLERGKTLRNGDKLSLPDGEIVEVVSSDEEVSTVTVDNPLLLIRICYHLGNRHVPLQLAKDFCRYQQDHVLDEMVANLGGKVTLESAQFEPEDGAYSSSHAHSH